MNLSSRVWLKDAGTNPLSSYRRKLYSSTVLKNISSNLHDSSLKTRWDSDRTTSGAQNGEDGYLLIEEVFEPSIYAAPTAQTEELGEAKRTSMRGFRNCLNSLTALVGKKTLRYTSISSEETVLRK